VGREVGFAAGGSNAGCYDLSGADIQIGDQRASVPWRSYSNS
jgi:hypothetical protein